MQFLILFVFEVHNIKKPKYYNNQLYYVVTEGVTKPLGNVALGTCSLIKTKEIIFHFCLVPKAMFLKLKSINNMTFGARQK